MGELTRQHDWSQTPLGAPGQWPQSLRTTLSIILNARFPMFLFWGPQYLCFYNDAYRPSLGEQGRHPSALGRPGFQVWADIWPTISPLLEQVMSGGEATFSQDERLPIRRNGALEDVYWTASYSPVVDEQGQIGGVFVTCFENTAAILSRQQLEESELFARTLFERSPVAKAVFVGPDMVIKTANQHMLTMWGKEASVIGQPFMEAMPELVPTLQLERLRQVLTTGERFYQAEEKFDLLRYGRPYAGYYEYTYEALRSVSGQIHGVMCVANEVTQQVLARQKIESNWALLNTLFQQAPVAMALLEGPEYTLKLANDSLYSMWQLPPGQSSVLGRPVFEAFPSIAGLGLEELLAQVRRTGVAVWGSEQPALIDRNGHSHTIYVDFAYSPIVSAGGEVDVMVVASDVTQQVEARRQLRQSEAQYRRLADQLEHQVQERTRELEGANADLTEANALLVRSNDNLQQFAYIASHDLQEPLRKIQQFGDVLKQQYRDNLGEGVDLLDRMQGAAARMSTLIRDLLAYSRIATQRSADESVALDSVVEQVLTDLELSIKESGAQLRVDALPLVRGDALQLGQLFQNLLTNALKFCRPGTAPLIQLRYQLAAVDAQFPVVGSVKANQVYHRVDVVDNGIGFEQKYAGRIFQVFQRLHGKNQYAGTGIGLAICQKVVTNHGGAITATSQVGQGATFSVYLPV